MSDDVFAADQGGESALEALVGEGKKFADAEALAKGKAESDNHIATIEQENATLKAQLEEYAKSGDATSTAKELLAAIKDAQSKPQGSEGDRPMSTEELQEVIKSGVVEVRTAETKASNRAKGNELVLKRVDGNVEAAREFVTERAKELGMTPEALGELSETSPEAFATLIGKDDSTASSGQTSILPGVRTDVLDSQAPVTEVDGFKTKAWFDAKRKEIGHVKFINDGNIQRELTRSMNGLGERFNN
jgi:hypothetical protein